MEESISKADDVLALIRSAKLSRYQRIVLPSGHVIPGQDHSDIADLVFPARLDGKTILDVGCYYGYFLYNAIERGAKRAVGIEADPEHYRVANLLAPLWGNKAEVLPGMIEDLELGDKFDLVLFSKVLHHVKDPLVVMRKLASLCKGTLVVIFRQSSDVQFLNERFRGSMRQVSPLVRRFRIIKAMMRAWILKRVVGDLGIVGIGATQYHRTFYFNPKAFKNLFLIHHRMFSSVSFTRLPKTDLMVAFCDCKETNDTPPPDAEAPS